jgi:hypothetical protein
LKVTISRAFQFFGTLHIGTKEGRNYRPTCNHRTHTPNKSGVNWV